MKFLTTCMIFLLLIGVGCIASAEDTQTAIVPVQATIASQLVVGVNQTSINLGVVKDKEFSANVSFHVDTNQPQLSLFVCATPMYLNGDPSLTDVPPIPLKTAVGVDISPASATPVGGRSTTAVFIGETDSISGFAAFKTESITFASATSDRFTEDVICTVTWDNTDDARVSGDYIGKVQLNAMLIDETL